MKICKTIEEGVASVIEMYRFSFDQQWSLRPAKDGELCDTLILDGKEYPFFWWRYDTQVSAITNLAPLRKPCSMKLNRSSAKSEGLDRLLYRELDIAERTLGEEIVSVMCYRNDPALNMLATTKSGRVAIFELASVLNDGTEEQGRHTLWGADGMASDRVVSQKVASQAIYLFTEEQKDPETYNDIFNYMYGLSKTDATKAAAVLEVLLGNVDPAEWKEADLRCRRYMAAADASARTGCRKEVAENE